jgi:hypothetical protein
MNVVELRSIASDAATIIESRLHDRRRSKIFYGLAERTDSNLASDLGSALKHVIGSLPAKDVAVAEELTELLPRLDRAAGSAGRIARNE